MSNSKVHNLALFLLSLNLFAGLLWLFGFHNLRLLLLAGSGAGLLLLFLFSLNKNTLFKWMLIVYIIIFGFLRNFYPHGAVNILIDFSTFGILFSVIFLRNLNERNIIRIILCIFLPSALYYLYTLPLMDFSLITAQGIKRAEAFNSFDNASLQGGAALGYVVYQSQQLVIGQLLLVLLLMPLIANQVKKKYIYAILGVSVTFIIIFSAFYQKRQQLVEVFLVLILSIIFNRKLLKGVLPQNLLVSLLAMIMIIYFASSSDIFVNVIDRFASTLSNVSEFDRLEESEEILTSFYWYDWIFGKGIGYVAPDTPGGIILHIGYSNLIMKGGIILLSFYIFQVFKNIRYCYFQSRRFPEYKVGIVISLFSLIQLSYAPGYGWQITTIITGLAMFSRYPLKSLIYDKYYNPSAKRR